MCKCDIICYCDTLDAAPISLGTITMDNLGGAGLLGKTRSLGTTIERADYSLFEDESLFRTYAYTLSARTIGIMANQSRSKQYETLKRLHKEILDEFKCSYIINVEIYPGSDNDLHCHGVIRFKSHTQKENFKRMIKQKITLGRKGTFKNLIDCEFVNKFDAWIGYISKDQENIIALGFEPFIKIDYSLHKTINGPNGPMSDKIAKPPARKRAKKDKFIGPLGLYETKTNDMFNEIKLEKLHDKLVKLKKQLARLGASDDDNVSETTRA